jgi:ATP-dependent protease Clp ATPase subunit
MDDPVRLLTEIRYSTFCGKSQHEVDYLIAAHNGTACICDACVDRAAHEVTVLRLRAAARAGAAKNVTVMPEPD